MIDPRKFPSVQPQYHPALEVALENRAKAKEKMADFRKQYRSAKAKVKRLVKEMAAMDEEKQRSTILDISYKVQLAENKFVLMDKKLKRYADVDEKYCKDAFARLASRERLSESTTVWLLTNADAILPSTESMLFDVLDMLRIAKGHLVKVDEGKKWLRHLNRRRRAAGLRPYGT